MPNCTCDFQLQTGSSPIHRQDCDVAVVDNTPGLEYTTMRVRRYVNWMDGVHPSSGRCEIYLYYNEVWWVSAMEKMFGRNSLWHQTARRIYQAATTDAALQPNRQAMIR